MIGLIGLLSCGLAIGLGIASLVVAAAGTGYGIYAGEEQQALQEEANDDALDAQESEGLAVEGQNNTNAYYRDLKIHSALAGQGSQLEILKAKSHDAKQKSKVLNAQHASVLESGDSRVSRPSRSNGSPVQAGHA